ncbi:MAG TPA: VCBS repeat-containing protein [Fimbriiglobus sp.]|jgi:hypothetical protein
MRHPLTSRPRRLAVERLEDRTAPATIPVTSLADAGAGSLRQAILDANNETANPGPDTIVFTGAAAHGTITLTSLGGTQFGPNALEVTSAIIIQGSGETITRDGAAVNFRLFYVSAAGNLTLSTVTLSNGFARGGNGGTNLGDDGGGGGGGMGAGGAIYNQGTLSIDRCTLTGNTANGGNGGSGADLTGTDAGGGGGGGGIGGNGGTTPDDGTDGGAGGGGFFGNGSGGSGILGGGGGGTMSDATGPSGGFANGGAGGEINVAGVNGGLGGGGGGAGDEGTGGNGGTGGGGGGGGENDNATPNSGGLGGFGGGGGGGGEDGAGGVGGFGGGGGGASTAGGGVALAGGAGGFGAGQGGESQTTRTSGGGGGGMGAGGAVFNDAGTVFVVNSTFSGNSAVGGGGGDQSGGTDTGSPGVGSGGGILTRNGTITVRNSTFSNNFANHGRGIYQVADGQNATVNLDNSILGQNSIGASDFESKVINGGTLASNGTGNLIHVNFGFTGTVVIEADPKLGPLQDNGGLTFTQLPAAGSPAVNAGDNTEIVGLAATDQRGAGYARIFGGTVDIGAVEVQPAVAARPIDAGGLSNGTALAFIPGGSAYQAGPINTFFAGVTVNVRTATADVTGDGIPDFIGGTGPGVATQVVVLDGKTGATVATIAPFEASFLGGVFVAAGDVDGDGKADVVVTPDQGGGPIAAIYSGAKLTAGQTGDAAQILRFFGIEDPNFRGGARAALGDLDGDGKADLVVSAGFLGGPRIALFKGASIAAGTPVRFVGDFFAFEQTLRNGAFVAAGDLTGDGLADLAFGGGPGGGPRVRIFDGAKLLAAPAFSTLDEVSPAAQVANFFAGTDTLRGGVRLAMPDADGNGTADLVTGSGEGEASRISLYKSANLLANAIPTADQELDPFGVTLASGVFVG